MFDAESARRGRAVQSDQRRSRIADYVLIGGPGMTAHEAAARIGVTRSTVVRYRRTLRAQGRQA